MFGWFTRRRQAAKRQIFSFYDGSRRRYADPLLIRRKLIEHPTFKWESDPLLIDQDNQFGRQAYRETLGAIRDVFGVRPLGEDMAGLTEEETLAIYVQYMEFVVKKNAMPNNSPTLPPSTPSTPVDSITAPGSGCSSIASGSTGDVRNPSGLPSSAPLAAS